MPAAIRALHARSIANRSDWIGGSCLADRSCMFTACARETGEVMSQQRVRCPRLPGEEAPTGRSRRARWARRSRRYIRITPLKSWSWNMDGQPVGDTWYTARRAVHEPAADEAGR